MAMEHDRGTRAQMPERHVVIAIIVVFLLVVLTGGGMMMGPGMMLGGPFLLVGLLLGFVWLARSGRLNDVMSSWDHTRGESARDILDARYARGELSDEQYDSMRRKLG
jgi:uncharacterized membrane protein